MHLLERLLLPMSPWDSGGDDLLDPTTSQHSSQHSTLIHVYSKWNYQLWYTYSIHSLHLLVAYHQPDLCHDTKAS